MTQTGRAQWSGIGLLIGLLCPPSMAEMPKVTIAEKLPPAKTLISLHLKDVSAKEAIDAFGKASGAPLGTAGDRTFASAGNVTIDADNQPYWVVFWDLIRQSKLAYGQGMASPDRIQTVVLPGGTGTTTLPPSQVCGPFFIMASSANRSSTLDYSHADQISSNAQIRLTVFADPQYSLFAFFPEMQVNEAIDEAGNSLLPKNSPVRPPSATARGESTTGQSFSLGTMLNYAPRANLKIKSLKAAARVQLLAKEDVWQIPELANAMGTDRSFPGGKYTLVSLAPNPQNPAQYVLKATIDYDLNIIGKGSPASPLIEYGTVRRAIRVTDAQGRELSQATAGVRNPTTNQRELSITYSLAGKPDDVDSLPSKLEWRIPLEVLDYTIPIELHDLPLP